MHMVTPAGLFLGERRDLDREGQSLLVQMPTGANLNDGENFAVTAGARTEVF